MKKILIPGALLLALTASGAAVAASATHELGSYTSPFDNANAYQQSVGKGDQVNWVTSADRRLQAESQRASTATVPGADRGQWVPASRDDLDDPE